MIWHHDDESGVDSKHNRVYLAVVHVAFAAAAGTLIALVFGYFVMLLWNGVLPHVTAARPISYWQAVGLLLLARILVGGLKRHGSCHGRGHRHGRRSWREYDQWWKDVGRQSFQDFERVPRESGNK